MANFLDDTQVEGIDGESERCRAALSPSWAVWGPNGGYVAAIALRAAMARSRLPRPASFHCDFLAVGEFAPVEIRVRSLGGGKRAESLRVEVVQQDRLLLTATAWMVDDGLEGFEHDFAAAPPVPAPGALRSYGEGAHARTIALLALVAVQLGHTFNCRSRVASVLTGLFDNVHIWAASATVIALQLFASTFTPLARLLGFTPIHAIDVVVIATCALLPIAIVEMQKLIVRRQIASAMQRVSPRASEASGVIPRL